MSTWTLILIVFAPWLILGAIYLWALILGTISGR
jgi:hypothetical protein